MSEKDKKNKDSADISKEELVSKHLNLVYYIAGRLAIALPSWIDEQDLISAGMVGLIEAASNYNQERGVKFETYASQRVRGAIMDDLRSMDWVPRKTRALSRQIENAIEVIQRRKGRPPTDDELADELGWTMDKYYKTIQLVSSTTFLSLDDLLREDANGHSMSFMDTVKSQDASVLDEMERKELQGLLVENMEKLSDSERLMIALYYYEELTLKEIGAVMNISESRVSQIHSAAVHKLRTLLRMRLSR